MRAAIWIAVMALAFLGVVRPFQANRACRDGSRLLPSDPQGALERLERAVALDPGRELYWIRLGAAAEMRGRLSSDPDERRRALTRSREAFAEARRLVPVNSYNHANLGRVLGALAREGLANPAQAFAAFDAALRLDANNAYFYADGANTALVLGDSARAARYAARGTALYPDFGPTRWLLGHIALVDGRLESAVRLLAQAFDSSWYGVEQGRVVAGSDLAAALIEQGRFEQAQAAARRALGLAPAYADARFNLARALELSGRRRAAIEEYRRLLVQHPTYARAREALRGLGAGSEVHKGRRQPAD